jgi:hypothetical protein
MEQSFTIEGIAFVVFGWGAIIGLVTYSFYKILRKKDK